MTLACSDALYGLRKQGLRWTWQGGTEPSDPDLRLRDGVGSDEVRVQVTAPLTGGNGPQNPDRGCRSHGALPKGGERGGGSVVRSTRR
jgi:hypothetical protein